MGPRHVRCLVCDTVLVVGWAKDRATEARIMRGHWQVEHPEAYGELMVHVASILDGLEMEKKADG